MTVSTFNPNTIAPVSFTNSAIKHLAKQVEINNAKGVEFKVKESGCSGYKYLLELAQEIEADAVTYPINDSLNLFVAPQALPLINGTQVDYVQTGVNFQLEFSNPNATASCGCGESFSVAQQTDMESQ
jgi:iron-sulfur cluster assembly accessory protein